MAGLQSTIVSYKKVGCTSRSSTTSNVENHFYTTCRCTRKTPGIYYNVLVEFLLKFTDIISLYEWKGCYAHVWKICGNPRTLECRGSQSRRAEIGQV